jgi:putative drug exporter of the RND superfamily
MSLSPESLARASSRHPWRTLGLWIVLLVAMGGISSSLLSGVLNQDIAFTNSPESVRAQDILDAKFAANESDTTEFFVIESSSATVDDPAFRDVVTGVKDATVQRLADEIPANQFVFTYYDALEQNPEAAASLVSQDQRVTLISVPLKETDDAVIEELRAVAEEHQTHGFSVQLAGPGTLNADFTKIAEEDLRKGESIGIMIALLVLIVVFAAILAAVLPVVMALFAIAVALGLVALIGQLFEFNLFVTNMITMIGLAVGIDYSLFIVSRYREERKKGFVKLEAIGAAGATADRAVFFSGLTVVLALLGMLIIPTTIFRALAGGAILVTLAALAASMTLLPAILALLGDRIDWPWLSRFALIITLFSLGAIGGIVGGVADAAGAPPLVVALAGVASVIAAVWILVRGIRSGSAGLTRFRHASATGEHDPRGGVWDRITRGVMARPVVFLVVSVLALGVLGSFYFQMHRGTSQNVSTLPDDIESKQAFLILEREFGGGRTDPVRIVITGDVQSPASQAAVERLRQGIGSSDLFSAQTEQATSPDSTAIEVDAFFRADPSSDAAFAGIRELRDEIVPAAFGDVEGVEVLVGGNTAFFTDFLDVANSYQWIVLAFVLALSFILLTVVFRSIVVPITAIIMNLLSVAAAYGAVTLVFQEGVGTGFFNAIGFQFQRAEAIEAWLPLFLFSILFGLSMDYHVFLLTRIREEYDKTHDNTEAVAYGLRTTAGIITGAALIMVAVFTGFAAGRLGPLQQMGFGLAVAVFMDATIVRTLLVPATMRLLGHRNWYLPGWLQWLPQIHVEGREPDVKVIRDEPEVLVSSDGHR